MQQFTNSGNFYFNYGHPLEWRTGLSNIILKGDYTRTIITKFGLIWFSGFRGEDLNMKVYDVQWMT